LAQDGQPLVRLVLAGGPSLEERFASPKLDSFSQRLSARCYLEPFNRTETQAYMWWQIDAAGGEGCRVFPESACQSVFQATGGVPRLVNQVCAHALLLADVAAENVVTPAMVEEAWADLQQLPTPWSGEAKNDSFENGVIEFGALDETSAPSAAASAGVAGAARVFRVAPGEEAEAVEADGEKTDRQFQRIERLLAEADDDFQPAGTIGPEIELRFADAPHPFLEEFEHEEVVLDRYGAAVRAAPPCPTRDGVLESTCVVPAGTGAEAANAFEGRTADAERFDDAATSRSGAAPEAKETATQPLSAAVAEPPRSEPPRQRDYRRLFARLLQG